MKNDEFYIDALKREIREKEESIKLALDHIHAGNFTLATVELNKSLSREVH